MASQAGSSKETTSATRRQQRAQPPTRSVARPPAVDALQVQCALAEPGAASPKAILALQRAGAVMRMAEPPPTCVPRPLRGLGAAEAQR